MFQRMMGGMLAAAMLLSAFAITVRAEENVETSPVSGVCIHGNTDNCISCDAVSAVQSAIEKLPSAETMLAMDNGGKNAVYDTLLEVTASYDLLPADDQVLVSNLDTMIALHDAFTKLVAPASANTAAGDGILGQYADTEDTDETCAGHTYTEASGDICTMCGRKYVPEQEANPKVMKSVRKDTRLLAAPDAENGKVLETLSNGEEILISHRFTDFTGKVWYLTADGAYVSSENLAEVTGKLALVFDANGGTGGPKSSVNEPNAVKRPPKAEPTREGYLFKGWAYRKNATYPEWIYDDLKKGGEIKLEKDTIFYAVWARPSGPVTVDSMTQEKLDKATGFPQVEEFYPNKSKGAGLCTSSATALLIKRKQIVDGYEGDLFDFTDVRMSLGAYENKGVDHYYNPSVKFEEGTEDDRWRRSFDGFWAQPIGFTNLHSEAEEHQRTTYYTAGKPVKELGRSAAELKNSIIELLEEHPEGVVIYSQYSGSLCHAIVLTGYDEEEGFYACDSVNVRDAHTEKWTSYTKSDTPTKLSETWLYSEIKQGVFGNLRNCGKAGCVWYIESVSYPNAQ